MGTDSHWADGMSAELSFWRRRMRATGAAAAGFRARLDPELPLQLPVTKFLDAEAQDVEVLDVGAGPVTWLGKRWGNRTVRVVATDALADRYAELLAAEGIVPPVPTLQCRSEELTGRFEQDRFDLVFARNTLDHSLDPIRALREMATVARPGGTVLTVHAENEGVEHAYSGMHGWNFRAGDAGLEIWNEERSVDVASQLADLAAPIHLSTQQVGETTLVTGAFRKHADDDDAGR